VTLSSTIRLAELCDLVTAQVDPSSCPADPYIGLEHVPSGRLTASQSGLAADVQSSKYRFLAGDVLYGKLRPYLDKAISTSQSGICSTELLVLRPRVGVDADFLACVLHAPAFIDYAMAGTTGVQHPRTSWTHISEFALPEFAPIEQAGIARLLWRIEQAITVSDRTTAIVEQLRQQGRRALFTRGTAREAHKQSEVGPVPESWDVVSLGSLGRIGNGSTPKKSNREYWDRGSFPWLTSAKVYDRDIVAADQFVSETALHECHLPVVAPGAVLIAITGQGKTLGHCAVLRTQATINQHLAYVATDQSIVDPSYLRGYLETQYDYLRQVGSAGGSTKGALTCAFLRTIPVPLPPLDEQRKIAEILDAIDRKIDLHRRKRAVLDELFKALLHKLMTGEIRVADLDFSALDPAPPPTGEAA